ncbi:response regulator receiver protein [Alkalispirochaeta americana]|uniref:Response regulator receiver protein n=1 Tax=Alkalispirochaeta americana TaxID=159291 RepID=A0A1N6UYT5_9SPIO|nr:response regulator [Alkalispirochaeta americana]SIQ70741.1 response regulator receiver protein [Alkalispirochaeta americana]
MRILAVDDSVSMRQTLAMVLSGENHDVHVAADGVAALNMMDCAFDLVITDINMAGMDGLELVRRIRAGDVCPYVPIIILTTESGAEKKREGMRAGATAWITKPFSKDLLLGTMAKVVHREGL